MNSPTSTFVLGILLLTTAACSMPTFTVASAAGTGDGGTIGKVTADAGGDTSPSTSSGDSGGSDGGLSSAVASNVAVNGQLTFGSVGCGTAAPPQTVTVANSGSSPFSFAATFARGSSSAFTVSPASGTVGPSSQVSLTVTPRAIPASSAVPGDYADTLSVQTNVDGDPPHLLPATEAAQGAILAFDMAAIPFGEVPVGAKQSSAFHVVNTGDVPATVTLETDGSAAFSISERDMMVAAGADMAEEVTFAPTAIGSVTGSIKVVPVAGAVLCSPAPAPLALTGVGENGGLAVSVASLTFGPTPCGTAAKAQAVTLTNSGTSSLTWTGTFANKSPSAYTLSPARTGALAAGESVSLTVTPGAIPATSSVQTDFYADSLTFNTDLAGDGPHVVSLHETASGAVLAWSTATVDFGAVPVSTTGTAKFQVVNSGNAPASATITASGSPFSVSPTTATAVAAAGNASFTGSFSPGSTASAATGDFTMTATGTLCGELPKPLPATGTGTNGVVSYAPGALVFGNQPTNGLTACGTSAAAQQVTFTNAGNQSYTVTPTLEQGATSPFTLTMSPSSGVAASSGGAVVITVTPKPIPAASAVPGAYGDTLSVSTTAAGDTAPHVITLSQAAYGAILSGPPAAIAFPATPVGAEAIVPVAITNTGNAPATLAWTAISSPVFTFDQNVAAASGGVMTSPNAYFTPTAASAYSGTATLGVSMGTVLCQPLPSPTVMLSGTGTDQSTVSVTPAQVNFNQVPCGTSGGSTVVTVKNDGIASITWSASLPDGASFTLSSPSSGTLAAGASATVTVTSNVIAVSATTSTTANAYGSQLTVTSSAENDTPHAVPILETASGAILSFSPASLDLPANEKGSPVSYSIVNGGNLAASVSLALNNPGPALLTLDPATSGMVASGTPLSGAMTEALASPASTDATVTLTPAMGTVLCAPAPAPMTVTAN